jgi:hypothetical protein
MFAMWMWRCLDGLHLDLDLPAAHTLLISALSRMLMHCITGVSSSRCDLNTCHNAGFWNFVNEHK